MITQKFKVEITSTTNHTLTPIEIQKVLLFAFPNHYINVYD